MKPRGNGVLEASSELLAYNSQHQERQLQASSTPSLVELVLASLHGRRDRPGA